MEEGYAEQPPMGAAPMDAKPDFSKWMLSNDEDIDKFENILKGYKFNSYERKWYKPENCTPWMDEVGIKVYVGYLSTFTSKNIALTNYRLDDINRRMEEIIGTIVTMVCDYYEDYNITVHPNTIIDMMQNIVESMLRRAVGNEERKLLMSTNNINRNEQVMPSTSGGGMFDFFSKGKQQQ